MTREELSRMLSAQATPLELAIWLRQRYLPLLIQAFNTPGARKRLGLYQGERIPDNERNLTDARNRVSLIIEYELARLSNQIVEERGETDLFWSYVVANRFPDLEVRRRDGTRSLRIEVKCLQSIAEEKAANFDTLKKDLNPATDFVVVFLWEWAYDGDEFQWDRSPKLHNCFVFQAYSLAELRDHYWLNKPPGDLGGGYQGFDLRFAVNCKNGSYAEEEGNYGKLLRIWKENFEYRPEDTPILLDTEQEYLKFQREVTLEGFKNLCDYHLPRLSQQDTVTRIVKDGVEIGARAGRFAFFSNSLLETRNVKPLLVENEVTYCVVMTDKYVCSGSKIDNGQLVQVFRGLKPKLLDRSLFGLA
ncbi:hypothetical protein Gbem_2994 [Citrifermentans bemidjiense Bem]|uniref:Uncharacterized protein n=1 Tax=Citrifermentans bemidjiense (strain ATCC BAA-1014 / DSM 16622 / JCM 12645 / Bem) TaxID=404380 RepID=B5E828_CITBB|nr:hypothetical protein [Citrifermentans bemidjiense]ACH39997.1 hypothetical protein Gbem_2994 [Citrifermentans bemidjiense Bem]